MKRLFLSSNFWNAIIATGILILCSKLNIEMNIIWMVGSLFGVRSVATGFQDVAKGIGGGIPPDDDKG